MANHSFNTLMRRLSRAGFKRPFLNAAVLPDWWDDSYAHDSAVLPDVEIRVARFLDVPLTTVQDPSMALSPPAYANAQLRRTRNINRGRLGPAIHTAVQIAHAVVRNIRREPTIETAPANALEWRYALTSNGDHAVRLPGMLRDLWKRGIPVIPLELLPTPGFQALACVADNHPVVLLGHHYDEPGRVSFLIAHEVGHIAVGDCTSQVPVLHESDAVMDESLSEQAADRFANLVLLGQERPEIPDQVDLDPKSLAQIAVDIEAHSGADASAVIYGWAARTLNYQRASLAVQALYRSRGARRELRKQFEENVDLRSASESDLNLLRCVYGDGEPTATAGRF